MTARNRVTGSRLPQLPAPGGYRLRAWVLLAVGAILAGGLGAGVGLHFSQRHRAAFPVHIYRVPARRAPGFRLTGQAGRPLTLRSLRGKAVALYFMDPRCIDICPLVAQQFIDADHDLGASAARVALIGVDVNPGYLGRRWLTAFDAHHGLNKLPNWHFLTGSLPRLRQVWENYDINVQVNPKTGEVTHTTVIDFIGPDGGLHATAVASARVLRDGTATLPAGRLGQWGHAIASQLRLLLTQHAGR